MFWWGKIYVLAMGAILPSYASATNERKEGRKEGYTSFATWFRVGLAPYLANDKILHVVQKCLHTVSWFASSKQSRTDSLKVYNFSPALLQQEDCQPFNWLCFCAFNSHPTHRNSGRQSFFSCFVFIPGKMLWQPNFHFSKITLKPLFKKSQFLSPQLH